MSPIQTVVLYASLAAGLAALGPLPLVGRSSPPRTLLAWAYALASGFMLGAAYLLMSAGLSYAPLPGGLGAALGVLFMWGSGAALGTSRQADGDIKDSHEFGEHKLLKENTLHALPEGTAIGSAMAVSPGFGLFVAVAMALHNVPEATVLSDRLRDRGSSLGRAAVLSVTSNLSQVAMAIGTFGLVQFAPEILPWLLGFSVGALIYLVMAELLPACYQKAGNTLVALITLLTMGIVVVLGGTNG